MGDTYIYCVWIGLALKSDVHSYGARASCILSCRDPHILDLGITTNHI